MSETSREAVVYPHSPLPKALEFPDPSRHFRHLLVSKTVFIQNHLSRASQNKTPYNVTHTCSLRPLSQSSTTPYMTENAVASPEQKVKMKEKSFRRKPWPRLGKPGGEAAGKRVGGTGLGTRLLTWAWGDEAPLTRPSICTCFTAESPDPPLPFPFPAAPVVELEEVVAEPVPSLRDAIFPAGQEKGEACVAGSGSTTFT